MRIGIVPDMDASNGGIHQYSMSMLYALDALAERFSEDTFIAFVPDPDDPHLARLPSSAWERVAMTPPPEPVTKPNGSWCGRQARRLLHRLKPAPITNDEPRTRIAAQQWFEQFRIDLMLYPSPCTLSFETAFPHLSVIHDLQHRLQPEFPEVSANGEAQRREYLFGNIARYANMILVDSEVGKEDVIECYGSIGASPDRIEVLPFVPSCHPRPRLTENERTALQTRLHLPERYLFYPAQCWPHKNHRRIVDALAQLKQQHDVEIPIVFTGSRCGQIRAQTWAEIETAMQAGNVSHLIHHLGYLPENDIAALYASAEALIMPTFFGPTNIPVLEAWACDCPVLTSDIRGIREQVGPAAELVDPRSTEALAAGIWRLWTNADRRTELVHAGRRRLATYTENDYHHRLAHILELARDRAQREGPRRKFDTTCCEEIAHGQ